MRNCLRLLVTLFIININLSISAQVDAYIEKVNGVKCYVHEVEAGHTLYAISKKYHISVENLIDSNPGIEESLVIGRKVYIPINLTNKKKAKKSAIEIKNGQLVHVVLKGETLFSISKRYNVSVNDLLNANDGLSNNVSIGQKIIIPVEKVEVQENKEVFKVATEDSLKIHNVLPGETLYGISKQYGITLDDLKRVNNNFPEGLKSNSTIFLPIANPNYTPSSIVDSTLTEISDSLALLSNDSLYISYLESDSAVVLKKDSSYKGTFEVALLLPFYFNKNSVLEHDLRNTDKLLYQPSKRALQFYLGVKAAIDSMVQKGMEVNLTVYDTRNDTSRVNQFFEKYNQEFNLIVGPLYNQTFEHAVQVLNDTKNPSPIVCPLGHNNKLLLGNGNVLKVKPSITTEVEKLSAFVADSFRNENVILLKSNIEEEAHQYQVVEKNLGTLLRNYGSDELKTSVFPDTDLEQLKLLFSTDKKNIIVFPSNSISVVSQFVTELKKLRNLPLYKDNTYIMVGLESWQKFNQIESEIKNEFEWHFTSSYYFNPDLLTHDFIYTYQKKSNLDPENLGLLGYDVANYFLNNLFYLGPDFLLKVNEIESQHSMITPIKMVKTGPENGFENRKVYILKYQDFELNKVE